MQQKQVEAIQAAVQILGSQAALARALGVTPVAVGQWLNPGQRTGRQVPPKQCVRIEKLTSGKVIRQSLRPDDWQAIWPELAASLTDEQRAALNTPVAPIVTPEEAFLKLANGLELVERRTGPADRRVAQQPFEGPDRRIAQQPRRACDRAPADIAGAGQGA